MNTLENAIGRLSEEAAKGVSRRDFIKLIFLTGSAAAITALGLDVTKASANPTCPACTIPCDTRAYCVQYATHYESCGSNQNLCPSSYCGPDKCCKENCWRCCYPNQCACGSWHVSSKTCVWCDTGCSSTCQSCSGTNCPSGPN